MPPELLSEGRLSKAADVYSFGVMLWEMCAKLSLQSSGRRR
jgi:serine/threonine protein kinase